MPRKKIRYVNATQAAFELDRAVTPQRMLYLCKKGRVKGAQLIGRVWSIPMPVTIKKGRRCGRPRLRKGQQLLNHPV